MMVYKTGRMSKECRGAILVLLSVLTSFPAAATVFTAVPLSTTSQACTMSVTSSTGTTVTSLLLGTGGTVDGNLLTDISQGWQVADNSKTGAGAVTPFNLQLKDCNEWSATFAVPKVMIGGDVNNSVPGSGNKMYMDKAGTTAKGFGVTVFAKASPVLGSDELANQDVISIPGVTSSTWLYGNYTIPMSAGVTCGPVTNCKAANLVPGDLAASVTFTLVYQ